jgi:hypothetical protein
LLKPVPPLQMRRPLSIQHRHWIET